MPDHPPSSPAILDSFWSLASGEALQLLAGTEKGLSQSSADDRLKTYGPILSRWLPRSSPILLFLRQFKSPLMLLLIGAFFKSLPSKYLLRTTSLVVLLVLTLPFTPLTSLFGFVSLPSSFFGWMGLIVAAYLGSAELLKQWFDRKLQKEY